MARVVSILCAFMLILTIPLEGGSFRRGDSNIDGTFDISDPVKILGTLFLGDAQLSAPETCGKDPTAESPDLGCERSPCP
ncbi:MAG: hypothetical protein MUE73_22180 [Planctomycetes bacterium]|jgi:hypothetical protein|nr:hypothetical protein [Planctomycetota bacterium]